MKNILSQIRLGSVLGALVIFFLPWVEIQCSYKEERGKKGGEEIVVCQQTGVGAILNLGHHPKEYVVFLNGEWGEGGLVYPEKSTTGSPGLGAELGPMGRWSPWEMSLLVGLALVAVVVALVLARRELKDKKNRGVKIGVLCGLALLLIVVKMNVGFHYYLDEDHGRGTRDTGQSFAYPAYFHQKFLPGIYAELLCLSIPVALIFVGRKRSLPRGDRREPSEDV